MRIPEIKNNPLKESISARKRTNVCVCVCVFIFRSAEWKEDDERYPRASYRIYNKSLAISRTSSLAIIRKDNPDARARKRRRIHVSGLFFYSPRATHARAALESAAEGIYLHGVYIYSRVCIYTRGPMAWSSAQKGAFAPREHRWRIPPPLRCFSRALCAAERRPPGRHYFFLTRVRAFARSLAFRRDSREIVGFW